MGRPYISQKSRGLRLEYEFLSKKYPNTKFFISSDKILNYPSGLSFQHPWKSRVVRSFKTLRETEIWTHAEKLDLGAKNFNRTAAVEQSKNFKLTNIATLRGALVTVFILVGGLIGFIILVFVVECRSQIGMLFRQVIILKRYHHTKILAKATMILAVHVCDIGKN